MVWLSVDCAIPSFAAALVKLRSLGDGQEPQQVVEVLPSPSARLARQRAKIYGSGR